MERGQIHYKINGFEFNPDRSVKESVKGRTSIPDAHRNAQVLLNEAKEERQQAQSLVLMKNMERDGGGKARLRGHTEGSKMNHDMIALFSGGVFLCLSNLLFVIMVLITFCHAYQEE
ncbi:hypothetical protein GXN76_02115 [Kroppenstedtia pulmonis]|uniref:Uncharacterized protein n=1 Tax=Kroppenstedtia pulmonis TaxID=1380685 RepID=A0A7D3XZX7_9BACL|nr:hypothetical protein [Kroppenstedtia pulmonis]QKG83383.1 hypothetical protein GXN76_02115 [Kroppenstedtia pulmonis]